MLSKYEPVILIALVVGAGLLMESRHRIDLAQGDDPQPRITTVIATCQPGPPNQRLAITSAFAAEGQAALLRYGDGEDLADACAVSYRNTASPDSLM